MSVDRKRLRPSREGLIVRDPITLKPLAADGELKPLSAYWLRRLRDGSAVIVKTPEPKKSRRRSEASTDTPEESD